MARKPGHPDGLTSMRWRYRTQVLTGPWRPTVEQAAADAIAHGQAVRDQSRPHGLAWRVPGRIEGNADSPGSRRI
jgi:hypothetical protein